MCLTETQVVLGFYRSVLTSARNVSSLEDFYQSDNF